MCHSWLAWGVPSEVWFITIFDSLARGLGDVVAWTAGAVFGDPVGLSQCCVTWGDAIQAAARCQWCNFRLSGLSASEGREAAHVWGRLKQNTDRVWFKMKTGNWAKYSRCISCWLHFPPAVRGNSPYLFHWTALSLLQIKTNNWVESSDCSVSTNYLKRFQVLSVGGC